MKLGITVSTYPSKFGPIVFRDGDIARDVRIIQSLGYQGVDLFINSKTDAEIDKLRAIFEGGGLEVVMYIAIFLAEMGVNFSDKDPEKRRESVRLFKIQIEKARRIGAKMMPIGFIRGNRVANEDLDDYYRRLAPSLAELGDFAQKRGIRLCLEPVNRYEINNFNNVGECLEFIEKYRLVQLGLLLDAFHMNIEDVSIEQSILNAGKKIEHFHCPDSNRYAAGSGHLDYDRILQALRSVGYHGYLTIEAFPIPSAEACAAASAEFLRRKL